MRHEVVKKTKFVWNLFDILTASQAYLAVRRPMQSGKTAP
jgi:hypothetical protein